MFCARIMHLSLECTNPPTKTATRSLHIREGDITYTFMIRIENMEHFKVLGFYYDMGQLISIIFNRSVS